MKPWMKWFIAAVIVLVFALVIGGTLLDRSAGRAATDNRAFRDFHDVTAPQLEQQIRSSLPMGSSRTTVENYLSYRGMEFGFDSSKNDIYSQARYLKGSNFIVRTDLGVQFHFDRAQKLQSIQTMVELTGP